MAQQDDATLADALRSSLAGDSAAYRRFLEGVIPILRGVARHKAYGAGEDELDDIVQDILFALHLKRHTWQVDQPLLPWVRAIARYRTIDVLRKRQKRIRDVSLDEVPEEAFADNPDPLARIELKQQIAKLNGKVGCVTRAMGLEGKDIAETAKQCNMTENAVRIAFHRALKRLRQGL